MPISCPLCKAEANIYYRFEKQNQRFYQCSNCRAVFPPYTHYPGKRDEEARYLEHHNDVNDKGYQQFVAPIVNQVLHDFNPEDQGLDFGAGTGPVISKLLRDKGYSIRVYDPFFHNHPGLLQQQYHYIACCEVVEHFHDPYSEFRMLKNLLQPGGRLYIMTDRIYEGLDFHQWNYKNDPTHVFIYHKQTFKWLQQAFQFSGLSILQRLVVLDR